MKRLALLVMLALATPAVAEINMADSIEWQTIDSDVVVRGFVTAVKRDGELFVASFQITETIKGTKKSLQFATRSDPARWREQKTDLLLFLVDGKSVEDDKDAARFALVLRPLRGSGASAFELGKDQAFTSAFGALTKPAEVLAAVRTAARSTATTSHRLDVPWDTAAMKALWGGSAVWMTVPVDAALEKLALAWVASPNASTREEGALALASFRSDTNIAIMKKLLADPAFSIVSATDKPTMKRYLVRAAAHDALARWHVAHQAPTLEERAAPGERPKN